MNQRYKFSAIDTKTYMIVDSQGPPHLLMINHALSQFTNIGISIAELGTASSDAYVEFVKEVVGFSWFCADWTQVVATTTSVLQALNKGMDVSNPVELAAMYGGHLNNETLNLPRPRMSGLQ